MTSSSGVTGLSLHTLVVAFAILLSALLLDSCAPPMPAPVISREVGSQHQYSSYAPRPRPGYYRIRSGDTIYSIAWRYGVDYREFAAWNHIRPPYRIHPGQYLRISGPTGGNQAATRTAPTIQPHLAIQSNTITVPKERTASKNESSETLKLRWQWPTNGTVSTRFRQGDQSNKGVVLSGRIGQDIKAAEAGTVVYSGSGLIGYGKLIIIKHNKNYLSAYGHNQKLLVKEGDRVKRGSHIADMGENGSGKAVLHFEIRRNGLPVDPLPLLPHRS